MKWVKTIAIPFAAMAVAGTAILLATSASAAAGPSLSISPSSGVTDGGAISITASGFTAGKQVFMVECFEHPQAQTDCDLTNILPATANASGGFTATFHPKIEKIGTGACKAGGTCYINASTPDHSEATIGSFTFAGGASSSAPTSTSSSAPTSTGSSTAAAAPTAVNAGSGGDAGKEGLPVGVVVLAMAGGLLVVGGAVRFVRR